MGRLFTESECFYINSLNRIDDGTGSTFSVIFNSNNIENYDRVVLLDANIPKSYYIINSSNNSIIVNENGVDRYISMPNGNYTRTSFVSVMTGLLNTGGVGWTYAITYKNMGVTEDDGKLTYTVSGNSGIQPIFKFPTVDTIYEQMGFNLGSTYEFIADTLTSTNVINLAQESTVFLRSDMVETNNNDNILQSFVTSSNGMYSIISFVNPDPIFYSRRINHKANTYKFYLTDELGQEINLNGLSYQFTLCMYKSNSIDDIIANFIKYTTLKDTI